jgi:hypothetical protein
MKTTASIPALLALLPALITATPLKRQFCGPFGMIAIHSGDPRVHLHSINANSNLFWIGQPTASYCPDHSITDCPPGNVTVLDAPEDLSTGISTSSEVPGGQEIYIQGPTQDNPGALTFNSAHTAVPIGGIVDQFSFTGSDLEYAGGGWFACPAYGAYYIQSGTISPSDSCIGINIDTFPYTGPTPAAWQYI